MGQRSAWGWPGRYECERRVTPSRVGIVASIVRDGRWRTGESSTNIEACQSAAKFGVNSSGNPLWPVNRSPSAYIS